MRVQTAKRMLRMREWVIQINACKQSGKTVLKWCNENGINPKTFYNRMRVVREEMLEIAEAVNADRANDVVGINAARVIPVENRSITSGKMHTEQFDGPVFAELPMPQATTAAISVRIDGCVIDVQNGADSAILEQVLRMVVRL